MPKTRKQELNGTVFDRVVDALNTQVEVARVCGITPQSVDQWPPGVVLPQYVRTIANELERRGKYNKDGELAVTVDEMLESYDEYKKQKIVA